MNSDPTIPRDLIECVHRDLKSGEQVLWMAQPTPFHFSDITTTKRIFGVLWIALSILFAWWYDAFQHPLNLVFPSLPSALIGIFLLASPWLPSYRTTPVKRTVYAITNRRVIFCYPDSIISEPIRSYMPDELHHVYCEQRKTGRGNVFLTFDYSDHSDPFEVVFMNVRDPEIVTKLVAKLAEQSAAPAAAFASSVER